MKTYLVIGGSSGIGKAVTNLLTSEGHKVYATYNTTEVAAENEHQEYHKLDVLEENIDLGFLPDAIDGLVYCPGSINLMPFSRISPDDFTADFELQVNGAIKVIQNVIRKLKKGNNPSVVMFSTVAVQAGFNYHSQVSVSKGAIEGLTKALAAEYAPKIRFNAVAPSLTDTPLAGKLLSSDDKKEANAQRHPLKKIGQPEDIAQMAAFLLSDKSSWVTGQIMHVDGGMSTLKV